MFTEMKRPKKWAKFEGTHDGQQNAFYCLKIESTTAT
jgi:hypothetical protein